MMSFVLHTMSGPLWIDGRYAYWARLRPRPVRYGTMRLDPTPDTSPLWEAALRDWPELGYILE